MKGLGVCILLVVFSKSFSKETDEFQDSPSLVRKLSAVCGKEGIKVIVRFFHPFTGVVYADGHYDTPKCIFINQENTTLRYPSETRFSFLIPADECGTVFHDPGSPLSTSFDRGNGKETDVIDNEVYMENTVMFQRNHFIQEQGDLAQTLRCLFPKEIRQPLQATLPLMAKRHHKHQIIQKDKGSWYRDNRSNNSLPQFPLTTSKKRFQQKGHIESVLPGRRGKSLDVENPELGTDNFTISNLTALPLRAEARSSASIKSPTQILYEFTSFYTIIYLLIVEFLS